MKGVHKGTGTVVDGLARNRCVVGVHDAVDEPDVHPLRNKLCLRDSHTFKERDVWAACLRGVRVVSLDAVVSELTEFVMLAARREKFERAYPYVACRYACLLYTSPSPRDS